MKKIFLIGVVLTLLFTNSFAQQTKGFIVQPYLQYATQQSIRIHWETASNANSIVEYGAAVFDSGKPVFTNVEKVTGLRTMHHITLKHLQPQTKYFYRAISILPSGDSIIATINTFETAVKDSSAFAFAIFSDSQNDFRNPEAWKRVSTQAYKERPNFALHAGDLVDLGNMKDDWVDEFLGQGNEFMKTIPIFSIPGNHEHDAAYYYQYMYVPQPYFYSFKYGNAEFFMIDTDQFQEEGTALYNAIDIALAKSTAYWKFVVHHHPPFSSDDDDFGNTYYEASTFGDGEVQQLLPLYEKYGVDIVFYGHIHTYERTWPILQNKVVTENGILYINLGGAGGGLETAAPTRSWFTQKLRTVHHFGYVTINQNSLQFEAIDENGVAFDRFSLDKSRKVLEQPVTPAAPVVTTNRRLFTDTLQLQLISANNNESIYYTTDGSTPSTNSTRYTGDKIILKQSAVLKTIAVNKVGTSRINSFTFQKESTYPAATLKKTTDGLRYGYFEGKIPDENDRYFDTIKTTQKGVVSNLDLNLIPHREKDWGAIFTGYIYVPVTGYYRFDGHADHRIRFHIHNKLLFDEKDRDVNYVGEIHLAKGYHPIKIEYYNSRPKRSFIELYYTGPQTERQAIPATSWKQ